METPALPHGSEHGVVHHARALDLLAALPDACIDLVYVDPPFNTGRVQTRKRIKSVRDETAARVGFGGKRYRDEHKGEAARFDDAFDDYLGFLEPHLREARRVLAPHGSLYVHLDAREVHYVKVRLDGIFGRDAFVNELVWAYDYGGRPRDAWPRKHDTILFYAKEPARRAWNREEIDRIPYMAPGLAGPEKAARGKLPTDVWWHTIVSPTGKEKLGYPTQKPVPIVERIVRASCVPGGVVLDFFAGSGTTGEAALRAGRTFVLVDESAAAIDATKRRFAKQRDARVRFA